MHGFYAGNDWELFRTSAPGRSHHRDRAGGRRRGEGERILRPAGDPVRRGRASSTSATSWWRGRSAPAPATSARRARETGKYKDIMKHEYTAEELDRDRRGGARRRQEYLRRDIRYWEDVKEGEELPPIARGPLSLMDTMGFLVGCGRGHTHGVLLKARSSIQATSSATPRRAAASSTPASAITANRSRRKSACRAPTTTARSARRGLHAGDQLDGRRRLPQARAHRVAPLQHHGRHHVVQGQGRAQIRQGQDMRWWTSRSAPRTSVAK